MRRLSVRLAVVLTCASVASSAVAATFNWTNNSGGVFSTAANWTPVGPPTSGDIARFNLPQAYTVTVNTTSATVNTLTQTQGDVTFDLNGNTLRPTNTTDNSMGSAGLVSTLRISDGLFRPGNFIVGAIAGSTSNLFLDTGSDTAVGTGAFHVGSFGTGNFTLQNGAKLSTPNGAGMGINTGGVGTATVSGTGSVWTAATTLRVGSAGNGTLNVLNGGAVTSSALEVGENLNSVGAMTVSGINATFTNSGVANIGGALATAPATSATLNIGAGGTMNLNGVTNLRTSATVNVTGGTLNLNTLNFAPGADINWSAGTIKFANGSAITPAVLDLLLDGSNTLRANRTLASDAGLLSLTTDLNMDGGRMNISSLQLAANLNVGAFSSINATGTITITGSRTLQIEDFGSIGATTSIINNGFLRLNGPLAAVTSLVTNNIGVVSGTGRFPNGINNGAGGTIRASEGDYLLIQTPGLTNSGNIELLGGTVEYSSMLTNAATGFISGRGIYRGSRTTPGAFGISNAGVMAFSAGHTDIYGDVLNTGAGKIIAAGGSVVTFYDDVVNNGSEIRTNVGSRSVFFGDVIGAGPFTGGGDVELNGDLRPGNSPANVSFGGNVDIGSTGGLIIELAGATKGSGYDSLTIAGAASLSGTLGVSFLGGFVPTAGQVFEILTAAGGIEGTFDVANLSALGGGLYLDLHYESTSVLLTVAGTPGDYNYDGHVDAADYVLWRKTTPQSGPGLPADGNNSGNVDSADHGVWQGNFGQPLPTGSGGTTDFAVPEPATIVLLLIALAFATRLRTS